ncbi:ComE operon protein 1 [invertebrate metagenome]|uniref:ComE operon protein 1 n=1 Tax=invertebrate metagenome TaxID=1711999 RepID=A0A2H9T8T1_9ZZZZ
MKDVKSLVMLALLWTFFTVAYADKQKEKSVKLPSGNFEQANKNTQKQSIQTVNVNQATAKELDKKLKGVGRRVAKKIVAYRNANGPYRSLEDLDKVRYVGKKILSRNKERIVFQ